MSKIFTVAITGTYLPEAAALIRGPLTQLLMSVKTRTVGKGWSDIQVQVNPSPTGIGAIAIRVAQSLKIEVIPLPDKLSETLVTDTDLVLCVKLDPADDVPDSVKEALDSAFDNVIEPWSDNERIHEMKVKFSAARLTPQTKEVNDVTVPRQSAPDRLDYSEFTNKITEWEQKTINTEPSPSHTTERDDIPAHGPDIMSDTNKSGGLQET